MGELVSETVAIAFVMNCLAKGITQLRNRSRSNGTVLGDTIAVTGLQLQVSGPQHRSNRSTCSIYTVGV
jgi:hypothetical protein